MLQPEMYWPPPRDRVTPRDVTPHRLYNSYDASVMQPSR